VIQYLSRINVSKLIPRPTSKFLIVMCNYCGNKQIILDTAKTIVTCMVCKEVIAKPRGGKAEIYGKVEKVLD